MVGTKLSPREKELHELLLTHPGSMKQIAHVMGLETGSAKKYLSRVMLKKGAYSRPALMQQEIMRLRAELCARAYD